MSIYGYSVSPVLINESGLFALMQNFKKNTDAPDDIRGGIVDKSGKIILPFEYECWVDRQG